MNARYSPASLRNPIPALILAAATLAGCSSARPLPFLTVHVFDAEHQPVPYAVVILDEGCCSSAAALSSCQGVTDEAGRTSMEVCPNDEGNVRMRLRTDPGKYRFAPIREVNVEKDRSVEIQVFPHRGAGLFEDLGK